MSNPLEKYYEEIENSERKTSDSNNIIADSGDRTGIDLSQLTKLVLFWLVGGFVSLMPDIVNIFVKSCISEALKEIFSKENIFVVTTTLTISVLLEMIFDQKRSNTKYILLGIEIILIVFSVYMSGVLHFGISVNYIHIIGFTTFILCTLISIIGYFVVCLRKGGANK